MWSYMLSLSGRLVAPIAVLCMLGCGIATDQAELSTTRLAATVPPPSETPEATLVPVEGRATAIATASRTATPLPTATPTPAPLELSFGPLDLVQGSFVIVSFQADAATASLLFDGNIYPMLAKEGRWWTVVGIGALAQPGQYEVLVRFQVTEDSEPVLFESSLTVLDTPYPPENITLDPETASLLTPELVQAELALRAGVFALFTEQQLWSGPFQRPSEGEISSHYGVGRSYNGGPVTDYHRGTDFAAAAGEPVLAAARGRVAFAGDLTVRGTAVILDHGAGVFSAYHHLSTIEVAEGSLVEAGQRIGTIGSSGLVTGPHLHWEVVIHGVEVDGEVVLALGLNIP